MPAGMPPATDCRQRSVAGLYYERTLSNMLGKLTSADDSGRTHNTYVALVALRLGTHIFMSLPSPSYAAREL